MMDERSSRIFIGLCLMVLVWIGVYWMWQPNQDPVITFEQPANEAPPNLVIDQPREQPREEPTIIAQIEPTESSPPETETQPQPRLIPPEFFEHIVQPNERMQTIAAKYFGSPDDWAIIARANPFVDPQKLTVGMTIRIPKDPQNLQGKIVGRDTQPGVIESHTGDKAAIIEYVVRPGDSLSVIAQRIYGSSRHARYIFDSNRDKLKSMDDISIGQLLRLPPLPDQPESQP